MIGILPAAGRASRLNGIPKFLLPVGDTYLLDFHLKAQKAAGVDPVIIGTHPHNYPFLCDCVIGAATCYPVETTTQSQTVLSARRFFGEAPALMTMADTWFEDATVLTRLVRPVLDFQAVVAVALWFLRPDQRGQLGQCLVRDGLVVDVIDKEPDCPYLYAWGALAWSRSFWGFIHPADPHPGYALARAIQAGIQPRAVFAEGAYYDLGTFAQYQRLLVDLREEAL